MAEEKTSLTPDEAKNLTEEQRKAGIVVEGTAPPFGGSWTFDPQANTLTLAEPPTATIAPEATKEKENA